MTAEQTALGMLGQVQNEPEGGPTREWVMQAYNEYMRRLSALERYQRQQSELFQKAIRERGLR